MYPAHRHLLLDDGLAYVNGSFTHAIDCDTELRAMTLDTEGNLFFIENLSIKKITPSREVSTVINNLSTPIQCIVAKNGTMFVVERIMKRLCPCIDENTKNWDFIKPNVYTIKRYTGNSMEILTFVSTFFDKGEVFWFTYWQHLPHISLCPDGRLLIYSNASLEATHDTCMVGNMLPIHLVEIEKYVDEPVDESPIQKICTNSQGAIYILDYSGAVYRGDFIARELKLKLAVTVVFNMIMDNNDNLYFLLCYKIYKINTLSENLDVFSRDNVIANWIDRDDCSYLTSADETGLYSCWNRNIEKIYFDNVYWTQSNNHFSF